MKLVSGEGLVSLNLKDTLVLKENLDFPKVLLGSSLEFGTSLLYKLFVRLAPKQATKQ